MSSTKCVNGKDKTWRRCCVDCENKLLINYVCNETITRKGRLQLFDIQYSHPNQYLIGEM